ncbi:hypothetical protein GCK32_009527, partial [Trichostrongylus colubriformis]
MSPDCFSLSFQKMKKYSTEKHLLQLHVNAALIILVMPEIIAISSISQKGAGTNTSPFLHQVSQSDSQHVPFYITYHDR